MILYLEVVLGRNGHLLLLDARVHEFLDATAGKTHHVVVVRPLIQLEHGRHTVEMMAGNEAGSLELREYAIDGGQADVLVRFEQALVDVLGTHVPRLCAAQDFKDLDPGQRNLEPGFAQIVAFQDTDSESERGDHANTDWTALSQARVGGGGFRACAANRSVFRYDARNTPKPSTNPPMQNPLFFLTSSRLAAAVLTVGLAAGATGCVYRIDIQQGNFLENKEIDQVTVGMTRSQVRYLLGTPVVGNAFQNSRWDYVYFLKHGRTSKTDQRHFTVYFEEDKVTRIERRGTDTPASATASSAPAK